MPLRKSADLNSSRFDTRFFLEYDFLSRFLSLLQPEPKMALPQFSIHSLPIVVRIEMIGIIGGMIADPSARP